MSAVPQKTAEMFLGILESFRSEYGGGGRGWQSAAARALGVHRSAISKVHAGERGVTVEMADRAQERLGFDGAYWSAPAGSSWKDFSVSAAGSSSVVLVDLLPRYGVSIGATQAVLVVAHIVFLTNDGVVRMDDGSGVSVTTESMRRVAKALGRVTILPMQGPARGNAP